MKRSEIQTLDDKFDLPGDVAEFVTGLSERLTNDNTLPSDYLKWCGYMNSAFGFRMQLMLMLHVISILKEQYIVLKNIDSKQYYSILSKYLAFAEEYPKFECYPLMMITHGRGLEIELSPVYINLKSLIGNNLRQVLMNILQFIGQFEYHSVPDEKDEKERIQVFLNDNQLTDETRLFMQVFILIRLIDRKKELGSDSYSTLESRMKLVLEAIKETV